MASVLSTRLPAPPSAQAVAQAIQASYGCSPMLAEAMAAGALSRTMDARALARRFGLITIDTADARARGLLQ